MSNSYHEQQYTSIFLQSVRRNSRAWTGVLVCIISTRGFYFGESRTEHLLTRDVDRTPVWDMRAAAIYRGVAPSFTILKSD